MRFEQEPVIAWLKNILRGPYRAIRSHPLTKTILMTRARILQTVSLNIRGARRAKKLIIFLVPGREMFSGGILSIFNLYRYSCDMGGGGAQVFVCFYPGEAGEISRYVRFSNNVRIYPFEMLISVCRDATEVLIHLPEFSAERIVNRMGWEELKSLRAEKNLKVNILNQNVTLMPRQEFIDQLRGVIPDLTCTTAHPRYTTAEFRQQWGVPLHFLPAWTYPDRAPATSYETKRNLMIVSHDESSFKEIVLDVLRRRFPELEILVIERMKFQDYIKLEKAAKWALTFGEGMDGYFGGVTLRGGVGFAVFNNEFFTEEYRVLPTVYPDYETLINRIADDIQALDHKQGMETYNAQVRRLITKTWGPDKTRAALAAFYRGEFTFP